MTSLPGLQKLSSASCDLDLWPPNPQSWSFHAPVRRITCVNWHQRQFIHFQNITFTSLVTDKRTDRCRMNEQIENIMPLSASLAWQRHKNKQIITEFYPIGFFALWKSCRTRSTSLLTFILAPSTANVLLANSIKTLFIAIDRHHTCWQRYDSWIKNLFVV